jgi:hypothetical protein
MTLDVLQYVDDLLMKTDPVTERKIEENSIEKMELH